MKTNLLKHLLPGIIALTLTSPLSADVIYRQTFGNDGTTSISVYDSTIDWNVLYATNIAPNVTGGSSLNPFYAGATARPGSPANLQNVNAPASRSEANGFFAVRNGGSTFYTVLAYADHYAIDQSAYEIDSIQWTAAASHTSSIRAAIQIADQWYVSTAVTPQSIIDDATRFAAEAVSYTIEFDVTRWYALTATPDSPFAISDTPVADLPGGVITAFGTYVIPRADVSTFVWMDSYTINAAAIPEPGMLALTGAFLGSILLIRRRLK